MTKSLRFAVKTYTLCQGFVNCWTVNDQPQTFATREAAQAEIDDFLADIQAEIEHGERADDDGYSADEFQIVEV